MCDWDSRSLWRTAHTNISYVKTAASNALIIHACSIYLLILRAVFVQFVYRSLRASNVLPINNFSTRCVYSIAMMGQVAELELGKNLQPSGIVAILHCYPPSARSMNNSLHWIMLAYVKIVLVTSGTSWENTSQECLVSILLRGCYYSCDHSLDWKWNVAYL